MTPQKGGGAAWGDGNVLPGSAVTRVTGDVNLSDVIKMCVKHTSGKSVFKNHVLERHTDHTKEMN